MPHASEPAPLEIGLVVNMPDAALEATERQFRSLLEEASGGSGVRLTLYALPDVPRSEESRQHIARTYANIAGLWTRSLDGLIVTGTEPQKPELSDEPYWGSLTRLIDWAETHTLSTVWSCLAAHAAVQHLDGIRRQRMPDKRFGVFDCTAVAEHPLIEGAPSGVRMPHSRWNDLPEERLAVCGYRVLTRSAEAGVDAFVRERNSLYVFFQGHPEYETVSLLLEYRRDIRRYLRGERDAYPNAPRGYFDKTTADGLDRFRARAIADRHDALIDEFPTSVLAAALDNSWRPTAVRMYRNWLGYLAARKARTLATA